MVPTYGTIPVFVSLQTHYRLYTVPHTVWHRFLYFIMESGCHTVAHLKIYRAGEKSAIGWQHIIRKVGPGVPGNDMLINIPYMEDLLRLVINACI